MTKSGFDLLAFMNGLVIGLCDAVNATLIRRIVRVLMPPVLFKVKWFTGRFNWGLSMAFLGRRNMMKKQCKAWLLGAGVLLSVLSQYAQATVCTNTPLSACE